MPPTSHPPLSGLASLRLAQWQAIRKHLEEWFAAPDLECLRVAMATYCSHFDFNAKPCWLFVIGPSSSGKTRLMIDPFTRQVAAHSISTITQSTFISGLSEKHGLLPNLPKTNGLSNGVLLFPDFSNFLALNPEVRAMLQAQLREIFDGSYQKHTGNTKNGIAWKGKVTIIAACTPELERYWGLENALGDRFLQVKLIPAPEEAAKAKFKKQMAAGPEIHQTTEKLISSFLEPEEIDWSTKIEIPDKIANYLFSISSMLTNLRTSVHRNFQGQVTGVGTRENFFRFSIMACHAMTTHAKMFNRDHLIKPDLKLAVRVLLDSAPSARLQALRHASELAEACTVKSFHEHFYPTRPPVATYRVVEELQYLGLLEVEKFGREKWIKMKQCDETEWFYKNILTQDWTQSGS